MALSTLTDQSLWIPNLEGLLEDELALRFNIFIEAWNNKSKRNISLLRVHFHSGSALCKQIIITQQWVCYSPSSMERCMASLALLGTLSITSRPSLISPLPSSQHVSSSWTDTATIDVRLEQIPEHYGGTSSRFSHLKQELILSDSLHRLDQVGRDGVGQSMPLLNFLHGQNDLKSHMTGFY